MKTFEEFLFEGVKFNDKENTFTFDFDNDGIDDTIKMQTPLFSKIGSMPADVYHFAYYVEPHTPKYNEFITYVKKAEALKNPDILNFVNMGVRKFATDKHINMHEFGAVLFPQSRSPINSKIVEICSTKYNMISRTYELIKNAAKYVKFDYDNFTNNVLSVKNDDGSPKYNADSRKRILNNIREIMYAINTSDDYVSIASTMKSEWRKYIYDFLIFKTEQDKKDFMRFTEKSVLIIDDIFSSGTTVNEIVKIVNAIAPNTKIVVFTLIGNPRNV